MSALVVGLIGPDEVDLFTSFADASPLGLKPPLEMYLDGLHQWYRPEWSWVALRDGQVVARVAFNGPPDAKLPFAMGSLEIGAYWVLGFSPIGRDPRSTSEAPSRFESQVGTAACTATS